MEVFVITPSVLLICSMQCIVPLLTPEWNKHEWQGPVSSPELSVNAAPVDFNKKVYSIISYCIGLTNI